jgi:hypothetical protein
VDGVDAERISHFGDRFAYYTKRMCTLSLDQDHYRYSSPTHYVVHPTVLVAWGRHHSLFPRLRELLVCGGLSIDPARDEQAIGHFLQNPSLNSLEVLRASKLGHLTQAALQSIDIIDITDDTPHLRLTHTLFESRITPHLTSLAITIQDLRDYDHEWETQVSVQDLHSLLALVGRYTSLTGLSVRWCFDLLDPDTNICLSLPPLPQLADLLIEGYFYPTLQVNVEQVQHVLTLYPRLEHWRYRSSVTESEYAPVSLSELLDLLHLYPSIEELPVVIASADLPSEDTIAQFGTHKYGPKLDVQAGVPTVDLDDVVSRVLPCARLNVLEIWVQSPL